jgi:hypothetical protein
MPPQHPEQRRQDPHRQRQRTAPGCEWGEARLCDHLAAELERHSLDQRASQLRNALPGCSAPCERNHTHIGVRAQGLSHLGAARDDVDDTGRHARLQRHAGKEDGRSGRVWGRLKHDCVAGGDSRANLFVNDSVEKMNEHMNSSNKEQGVGRTFQTAIMRG